MAEKKLYAQGALRKLCGIGPTETQLCHYAIRIDGLWFRPPPGFENLALEEQEGLSGFQDLEPIETPDGLLLGSSTTEGVKPLLNFPFTSAELKAFDFAAGDEISSRLMMGDDYEQWFAEQSLNVQELANSLLSAEKIEPNSEEVEAGAAYLNAVDKNEAATLLERQNWRVKNPQRYSVYGAALHRLLCAEWQKGRLRRPTAREVLEIWSVSRPPEVFEVMQEGFKYLDGTGNPKEVTVRALKEAITRMTDAARLTR